MLKLHLWIEILLWKYSYISQSYHCNVLLDLRYIIYFICTNLLELFKIWPRSSNFRQETQTLTMRHSYNRIANLEPGKVDQAGPDLIFWGLAEKFQVNRAGPGRFVQDFRVDWAGLGQWLTTLSCNSTFCCFLELFSFDETRFSISLTRFTSPNFLCGNLQNFVDIYFDSFFDLDCITIT